LDRPRLAAVQALFDNRRHFVPEFLVCYALVAADLSLQSSQFALEGSKSGKIVSDPAPGSS
jgi:hypothetical protein